MERVVKNVNVTICGASGGTGQLLSSLLKRSPWISALKLYDVNTNLNSVKVNAPVIGGHSGVTVIPLISQMTIRHYSASGKTGAQIVPLSFAQKVTNFFYRDYNRGPRDFDSSIEFLEKFNPDYHLSDDDGYQVSKQLLDEANARISEKDEQIGVLKNQLDALKGMLGTVGGRGIVDKFFSVHVKPYAVVKDPGTSYTGAEIRRAYENFLKDSKNPVAIALLKYFPNESVRDVAKRYQKLYGKISWYDHTLYEALIKMLTIEQFINTIQSIPAFLLTKEKYSLEKMIEVFIEFKDDYQT